MISPVYIKLFQEQYVCWEATCASIAMNENSYLPYFFWASFLKIRLNRGIQDVTRRLQILNVLIHCFDNLLMFLLDLKWFYSWIYYLISVSSEYETNLF
jgi:hypothetical protein